MIRFDVVKYHFEGEEDRRPDYHLGRIHLLFRITTRISAFPACTGWSSAIVTNAAVRGGTLRW